MDVDTFIITTFCLIDDVLQRGIPSAFLPQRGPAASLCPSEVLTMVAVGEFLGLDQDVALYRFFRTHYQPFFPALATLHRTSFVRQAANLWSLTHWVWQRLADHSWHNDRAAIVDSFPLPVCRFARAYRCRRFAGEVAFGKDQVARQTFLGFRVHVRLVWPGIVRQVVVVPANEGETAQVPLLAGGTYGNLLGDRNYHAPLLTEELLDQGVTLLAPYRFASRDPSPAWSAHLSRLRYRIDTVFGQLVERFHIKRIWAHDTWHAWSRLLRKFLSHTIGVIIATSTTGRPLQLQAVLD